MYKEKPKTIMVPERIYREMDKAKKLWQADVNGKRSWPEFMEFLAHAYILGRGLKT